MAGRVQCRDLVRHTLKVSSRREANQAMPALRPAQPSSRDMQSLQAANWAPHALLSDLPDGEREEGEGADQAHCKHK